MSRPRSPAIYASAPPRSAARPCRSSAACHFTLEPGKILGLVGESGAGKSMVGRTIAQLLPPGFAVTGGTLEFDGE